VPKGLADQVKLCLHGHEGPGGEGGVWGPRAAPGLVPFTVLMGLGAAVAQKIEKWLLECLG